MVKSPTWIDNFTKHHSNSLLAVDYNDNHDSHQNCYKKEDDQKQNNQLSNSKGTGTFITIFKQKKNIIIRIIFHSR